MTTINKSPQFEMAESWGPGYALAKGDGAGVVVGPGRGNPNVFAQQFPIQPGAQLKVTARAASAGNDSATAAIQVNWHQAGGGFLGTSSKAFPVGASRR